MVYRRIITLFGIKAGGLLMHNDVELFNLDFSYEENSIESNIKCSKIFREADEKAKGTSCYICGKDCSSFCNSHSVPAFCLRNITDNGLIATNNKLLNAPFLKSEKGINSTGTFRLICNTCDSKVFSEYENPDNYEIQPTQKMIAEIALKNYLKSIYKRKCEIELYDILSKKGLSKNYLSNIQKFNKHDLVEFEEGYIRAKNVIDKNLSNAYYLFYYEKLDYVVPIAFQEKVALLTDLKNNMINNVYSELPEYKIKYLHICVFPMKSKSVIMMFVDAQDNRYRQFYQQFKKLPQADKLLTINYILINYCEDVYFSNQLDSNVYRNEELIQASRRTALSISHSPDADPWNLAKEEYDLSNRNQIPNLLSREYAII